MQFAVDLVALYKTSLETVVVSSSNMLTFVAEMCTIRLFAPSLN